jgi:hypothetical protein
VNAPSCRYITPSGSAALDMPLAHRRGYWTLQRTLRASGYVRSVSSLVFDSVCGSHPWGRPPSGDRGLRQDALRRRNVFDGQMGPDAPPAVTVHSGKRWKVDVVPTRHRAALRLGMRLASRVSPRPPLRQACTRHQDHTHGRAAPRRSFSVPATHICAGNLLRSWNWTTTRKDVFVHSRMYIR